VRFSGAAAGYARFRPGYPEALVDWVVAESAVREGDRVVDVGCGTGILTRMLARRGFDVVGIDPNEDMLAVEFPYRTVALVFQIRPNQVRTS